MALFLIVQCNSPTLKQYLLLGRKDVCLPAQLVGFIEATGWLWLEMGCWARWTLELQAYTVCAFMGESPVVVGSLFLTTRQTERILLDWANSRILCSS